MNNKTNFVEFSAIKKAVSIQQVLVHYGVMAELEQKGDSLTGTCPTHKGHNRTQFRVSLSKNCWRCFGNCNAGGNILDFVQRMEGLSNIRDAALLIQDWFSSSTHSKPPKTAAQDCARRGSKRKRLEKEAVPIATQEPGENPPLKFALQHLDPEHPYLKERGLSGETIAEFSLGFCQKGMMASRIAIPIHNMTGELVAYVGRWPGQPPEDTPKYKLPPGFHKSLELYNLHRTQRDCLPQKDGLVIVEGFFDCMMLWQAGIRNVVALMGSSKSAHQEKLIVEAVGINGCVTLIFDGDEAGQKGQADALERLSSRLFVKCVSLDQGTQPDSLSAEQIQELFS